ncbi:MAG: hypothetical protein MUC50_12290 [Myxococcota bacterium]|jgi:uncharacterized peroxidase-related enzyme|nr:hypothetical protein [Myxococcota bacterium]
MSLLRTVEPKNATGAVAAIYEQLQKQMGMVPNGLRIFSASPYRLEAQAKELGYYMRHPTLGSQLTAAIRYTVAAMHGCDYCAVVNGGMLRQAGWPAEVVEGLVGEPAAARLEPKDKAMFLLVLKALRTPAQVSQSDVDELRNLGWNDGDIFDAVAHGAMSVAFDNILNAFKVTAEGR